MFIKDDLQKRWWDLELKIAEKFGKKPDVEAILFLIGMQETGFIQQKITKEQKQDLMHVAVCTLLSQLGYYVYIARDDDGWPHFDSVMPVPVGEGLNSQEQLLKECVVRYFESDDASLLD